MSTESQVTEIERLTARVAELEKENAELRASAKEWEQKHVDKRVECHDLRNEIAIHVSVRQLTERLGSKVISIYQSYMRLTREEARSIPESLVAAIWANAEPAAKLLDLETRRLEKKKREVDTGNETGRRKIA